MTQSRPRVTSALPTISHENPLEDTCPICRTSRYLNRDLLLQINPECYHPICTSCIARIFKDGPAQCPYEGCYKTLRQRNFRTPTFSDLNVEREVDIRRKVAAIFNQTEDDFEDLRAYNDYLNMVEDLTDALVNGPEDKRLDARGTMDAWEAKHRAEIAANKKRRGEADEHLKKQIEEEERESKARRVQALKEAEEDREREAKWREEMLNGLAEGQSGHAAQTLNKIMLKKRGQKREAEKVDYSGSSLSIRGLKRRVPVDDNKPYDPFGGLDLSPSRYVLAEKVGEGEYHNEWIDIARSGHEFKVGGYSTEEYISRVMFEAFSGLGVFIEEEKLGERRTEVSSAMEVDDVF